MGRIRANTGANYNYNKAYTMARSKPATVKTVKRMINKNIETKMFEATNGQTITPGNTWSISVISDIAKGDAVNNRDGDKVKAQILTVRQQIAVNASNTTGEVVRIAFIMDKQARGAVPSATDLGLVDDATGANQLMVSNLNYQGRFVVLKDTTYSLDTSQRFKCIKFSRYLRDKILQFGTEGDDYENNAIFVCFWSSNNTNKATITSKYRLTFKDV